MRPVSDEVRAGEGVGDTDFVGVCSWRFQILALPNSKTIHFDTLFTLWASFILLRIQNSDWHDRIIITNRSWLPGASICVVTSSQAFPVWIIFRTIISREKNCFRGRPHRTAKEKFFHHLDPASIKCWYHTREPSAPPTLTSCPALPLKKDPALFKVLNNELWTVNPV